MKLFLFHLTLILFISCTDHEATNEKSFDISVVKSHIVEMNKTYSDRFMSNDTAFYIERYCRDAEVYSPAVPILKGRDAIREFFYANGANKEAKIDLPPGNFYGNEEMVVEEGIYNFPDGKGGSVDKGKFIAIWKPEDGKWKLFREIWNSDIPPVPVLK